MNFLLNNQMGKSVQKINILFYRYTFTECIDQRCFFGDILTFNHHIIYNTQKYCVNVTVMYNAIHLPKRNNKTYNL